MSTEPGAVEQLRLTVTASFTAEPLEAAITFWARQLGLSLSLRFAPSGQVLAQLLDPDSTLAGNPDGINLVLLRLEDFRPDGAPAPGERELAELAAALRIAAARGSGQLLLAVCPGPPGGGTRPDLGRSLLASVAASPAIHVLDPELTAARYPTTDYADEFAYQLGQVPYTPAYFAALGTALVREIQAIGTPRPKLLVVDCDQTLWDGVVGEDGPDGVRIGPDRRELQQFLVDQHDAGRLVCLCSKNLPADLWAVFDRHPDAPLTRAHLAGARINWQPKSANVRELAAELGVALDSVVFLDDNPVECAELRAALPAVLALPVPAEAGAAVRFLRHCWPLDAPQVTEDDRHRTARYHQERQRQAWREEAPTLAAFLAGLRLTVTISPLQAGDLAQVARAAQLTQRTNQFNLATTRHTPAELAAQATRWSVVDVSDRFGEYGLTGLVRASVGADALVVDALLLSCRVLGRGVEHRVLAYLGKLACDHGVAVVELAYRPTDRNQVARVFLARIAGAPVRVESGTWWYAIPADTAAAATPAAAPAAESNGGAAAPDPVPAVGGPDRPGTPPAGGAAGPLVTRIATTLATPAQLLAAIEADRVAQAQLPGPGSWQPGPVEAEIAKRWTELLRRSPTAATDNFFALGGQSLQVVQFMAWVRERFGVELPVDRLFTSTFTVADAAAAITQRQLDQVAGHFGQVSAAQAEELLEAVERLSDAEIDALLAAEE